MSKYLSIFHKIAILYLFLVLVVIITFILLSFLRVRQENDIIETSRQQYAKEIKNFLDIKSSAIDKLITDYTIWEELCNNINSLRWHNQNIGKILDYYSFNEIIIYDRLGKLIYKRAKSSGNVMDTVLLKIIPKKRLFYKQKADNLNEIRIYPIKKNIMSEEIVGYFGINKVIDSFFIRDIEMTTNSYCYFGNQNEIENKIKKDDTNYAFIPLYNENSKVERYLICSKKTVLIEFYHQYLVSIILLFLGALLIRFFILTYFIKTWISNPLRVIIKKLFNEKKGTFKYKVAKEFSLINKLIDNYFDQKKELILAKEKAEESDKMKSAFLANISHELRTPMNGINGFLDVLKDPDLSGREKDDCLKAIEESSRRLFHMIDDILSISKIDSGVIPINYSVINLYEVCNSVISKHKDLVDKKNIYLRFDYDFVPIKIVTDREKLKIIINNILHNAIKFTEEGTIFINVQSDKKQLKITISDSGIGIKEKNLHKIFDRFFQEDTSLSRKNDGMGLGLFIAKSYVEAIGGTIIAESYHGQGSKFTLLIPYIIPY